MGDEAVWYCGSGNYCCSRANDCCQDSQVEKHNLGEPSVVAIAGKTTPTVSIAPIASTSSPSITPTQTATSQSSGKSSTNTRTIAIAVGVVAGVLFVLLVGGAWYIIRKRKARQNQPVMHELSTAGAPANKHDDVRPYAYDDKRGGWVIGANGKQNKRRREDATQDGGIVHEVQADRIAEMPAQAEVKEMDGMGSKLQGADGRGFHQIDGDEADTRSLMGSRRSRFVEVDMGAGGNSSAGSRR